jgi:hypothetical protein
MLSTTLLTAELIKNRLFFVFISFDGHLDILNVGTEYIFLLISLQRIRA